MKSIWNEAEKTTFSAFFGETKTDILIIGGGLCGLLCAYMLKNAGVDCLLVEADTICGGVTNGTTAKVTTQHGLIYSAIVQRYGVEQAALYYKSQAEAFEQLKNLAGEQQVPFEICRSFVYSLHDRRAIEKELSTLHAIGADASFCDKTELPFAVAGAVRTENQARFHPLRFARAIARGLDIYEHTKVINIKPGEVATNNGTIKAKSIIVATHFPLVNKHGGYFLKLYQHRSYVLALQNAQKLVDMYVDEAQEGLSFRPYEDILLLGGGAHRTGKHGGNWTVLERFAKQYYPEAEIIAKWATQDCMTLDGIPYIGHYAGAMPNVYVATGFNKWGMTSSMVSAMVLSDLVLGKQSEYRSLYSPDRTMLHPQLFFNLFESCKSLLTPTTPRCPHMGCALRYNRAEHSWDCPCHGSRFEESGRLINNPATDDKRL